MSINASEKIKQILKNAKDELLALAARAVVYRDSAGLEQILIVGISAGLIFEHEATWYRELMPEDS